jgi:hypothetical protein
MVFMNPDRFKVLKCRPTISHQHLAIKYLVYLANRFLSSEYLLKTLS